MYNENIKDVCFIVGIYRVHEMILWREKKTMKVKELMHSSFEAFFFLPFSLMICFNMFIISKKIFTTQKIKLCVLSNSNTTQKKKKLKTSKKSSL